MFDLLLDTPMTWPGAFGLFLTAGCVVWILGIWIIGRRWGEEPLRWAALIAVGGLGAAVGSRVYMSHWDAWAAALHLGALPSVHGKNLLGAVTGTALSTLLFRRVVGFRARWEDAYGLTLPVAILVGRFGCLFGGCCHGIPTGGAWGLRYPAGSAAHAHQVAQGLLDPAAAVSLPVHPAQVYEILYMIPLIALVVRIHPHLRRRGSTLLVTLAGYGTLRFLQEFLRDGGQVVMGLKQVQWALLVTVVGAALALWRREGRAPAVEDAPDAPTPVPWRGVRIAGFAAGALLLALSWLSPLETFLVFLGALPLLWTGTAWLAQRVLPHLPTGWRRALPAAATAATLAAWTPMALRPEEPADEEETVRAEFGLQGAQASYLYSEGGCNEPSTTTKFTDHMWAMQGTAAWRKHYSDRRFLEVGVTAYGARVGRTEGPSRGRWLDEDGNVSLESSFLPFPSAIQQGAPVTYSMGGLEPYVGYDGYWFSIYGGAHIFGSAELKVGGFMAAGSLRLGPRDLVHAELRFLHDQEILANQLLKVGAGITLGPAGLLRIGWEPGDTLYVEPELRFKARGLEWTLNPSYRVDLHHPKTNGSVSLSAGVIIPLP